MKSKTIGNIFLGLFLFGLLSMLIFIPKGDIYCGSNCARDIISTIGFGIVLSVLLCCGLDLKYNLFKTSHNAPKEKQEDRNGI